MDLTDFTKVTALLLMAFFWFEVINQFADMKVTPFLSKK